MNTTSCESGLLKIGDLVRLTGKTPRTLHFYEELGLLRPVSRTKGGFRLYGEETLLRVRWIERLQRALEQWQPEFIQWWKDMGPEGFQEKDVYLRTAVSVDADGWAVFDHVKMPDYRLSLIHI